MRAAPAIKHIGVKVLMLCLVVAMSTGSVFAQSVVVNQDLSFGFIYPGVPKEIDKTTTGAAAEFLVTGTEGDEVSVTFTLPSYMSQNGFTMQILFPQTSCALDSSAVPDQSSPPVDNIDPYDPFTYRLGSAGLTIWLGGKVIPKLVQPPGDYTADIVITVAYTGL